MKQKRQILISGGGPSGLAAALLFHELGWEDIILVERRASPKDFEKNKSFNYLVDARGQKLLQQFGFRDELYDYGVDTKDFTATTIAADGSVKIMTPPIVDPNRPVAFWTTRRNLLTLLHSKVQERGDGRIKLLYDHSLAEISQDANGRPQVEVTAKDGSTQSFTPNLLLACDGLNSAVRKALDTHADVPDGHFAMVQHDSISAGLQYKVLNLPATFQAAGGDVAVEDHRMSYIIPSRHKDRKKTCALFAFPVANPDHPRSVNLIREADHELWTIDTADDLFAFLEDSFPQLDVRALISQEEAEDFARLQPGTFPKPQYASHLHAEIGKGEEAMQCLLIGDAAHAFPPDLGMGVNSALEDLYTLGAILRQQPDLKKAAASYERKRMPDSMALVKLVQTVFPEQYNHRPLRMIIWIIGFMVRRGLNKMMPWLIDKPAFHLTQDPSLRFSDMLRKKKRSDLIVRGLGAFLLGLLIWLIFGLF